MDYLVSTISDRYGDEKIINLCLPDVIKIAQVTKSEKFNNYIGLVHSKENAEILDKLSKIKNVELVTMPGNLTLILIYHIKFLNESPKLTDLFNVSNTIRLENCNVVYLEVSAETGKIESAYKFVELISMTQVRICDVSLMNPDTDTYLKYPYKLFVT